MQKVDRKLLASDKFQGYAADPNFMHACIWSRQTCVGPGQSISAFWRLVEWWYCVHVTAYFPVFSRSAAISVDGNYISSRRQRSWLPAGAVAAGMPAR